jgi:hypothetical protein
MRTMVHITLMLLVATALYAQDSARAVILSPRVGEAIDRDDRDAYRLFPGIGDFRLARFYVMSDGSYFGHVSRGTGAETKDTVIWYSPPALSAIGEQIDHYEALSRAEYAIGSTPAVLQYGNTAPLAAFSGLPGYDRKPARPPAPAAIGTAAPALPSVPAELPPRSFETRLSQSADLPPCSKRDAVIPRVCDTLDAQAWRYFGLVPAWGTVSRATFARNADGVLLVAETERGPMSRLLSEGDAALLADYLAEFESHVRGYEGGSMPVRENLVHLRDAEDFLPLYNSGLLGLHRIGYGETTSVDALVTGGSQFRGTLLYASDRAVYLWTVEQDVLPFKHRGAVQRIPSKALVSLSHRRNGSFGQGFLYGAGAGLVLFSTALSGFENAHNSGTDYGGVSMGVLVGSVLAVAPGLVGGLITSMDGPPMRLATNPNDGEAGMELRALQAFPFDPPPEILALADPDERRWIDSVGSNRAAFAPSRGTDPSQRTAEERLGLPPRPASAVGVEFAVNYGWNFYHNGVESGRWSSVWYGFELGVPIRLFVPTADRMGLTLRPHIAAGTNNSRIGVDLLWHTMHRFHLLTGIDYQLMNEGDMGHYRWGYSDVWDQSTTLSRLFVPVGLGFDSEGGSFEIQYRIALGKPLYSVGPSSQWYTNPDTLPGDDRGFPAILFRMSWKLY